MATPDEREVLAEAREELDHAVDEWRTGLDEVLVSARQRLDAMDHEPMCEYADVTPDVCGELWELARRMPGVIGNSLSGDAERVTNARDTLTRLAGGLRDAGVDLDDRFGGFADRLAGLREGFGRDS